jgi:hypothetical protein
MMAVRQLACMRRNYGFEFGNRNMIKIRRGRWMTILVLLMAAVAWSVRYANQPSGSGDAANAAPTRITAEANASIQSLTMAELLDLAQAARQSMSASLDDYTADFVKQEVDKNGTLGGVSEMTMKVQTRLRGDSEQAPMRVYLKFHAPENIKGREVIWAEDLHEGKMAVHEVGLLLSLKTLWLDPEGILAMQGQRYPIGEIGLVKLTEKLIERGEKDRNNPDITVTLSPDRSQPGLETQLIQVRRAKPSGSEDDFSLAEVVFDPQRQLILSYRSFGWSEQPGIDPPLLESYTYRNVQTNVGLSESDFDPSNPEYSFPAF